jgi:hypothetical protein
LDIGNFPLNVIYINKHHIETEDSLFSIGVTSDYSYYDFKYQLKEIFRPLRFNFAPGASALGLYSIQLTLDEDEYFETRTAYTIFDLFGDVGGFLEILFIIGGVILATYSETSFITKAISKLYLARSKNLSLFLSSKK